MKLAAVAIDYDGTIAVDGAFDPGARDAIAQLRLHGIAVILVTGRRLDDLSRVAGNLECFNAIVAENGAVLYFLRQRTARRDRSHTEFPARRRDARAGHRHHRRRVGY